MHQKGTTFDGDDLEMAKKENYSHDHSYLIGPGRDWELEYDAFHRCCLHFQQPFFESSINLLESLSGE